MKQERVIAARDDADLDGNGGWDAVVIGTGMGGAAVGHRLTQAGLRVLFLEKGDATIRPLAPGLDAGMVGDPDLRRRAGHWPDRVRLTLDGSESDVLLPLGMGVGGSTTLYAAALERFERTDVEDTPELPHPTGGWPVPWIRWLRYYAEAERCLRVRTDLDPSRAGDAVLLGLPPASAVDRGYAALLRGNGLHPYRLHVGIGYRPGCTECGGHRCLHRCKSDARTIFIDPALASGRAELRAGCDVLRLDADGARVRRVVYRRGDREEAVSARIVVLAAGAYGSPAILLRSANDQWPTGLANEADLVGRNLMFHANEWLAVWPTAGRSTAGPRKTIGLRDHYAHAGMRLGAVQSTGLTAGFGNICAFFKARLELSRLRRVPGLEKLLKLGALVAVRLFGNASIFVMLVEDFGMPGNRVMLDPDDPARLAVRYTVPAELRRRARLARSLLKRSFRGARALSLQGDVQLNLGHACGTCRFGVDPATSVLDPDCRAHGVSNLYVVDASFMPSSGGANPALTIAANALRVGDAIAGRLRAEEPTRRTETARA